MEDLLAEKILTAENAEMSRRDREENPEVKLLTRVHGFVFYLGYSAFCVALLPRSLRLRALAWIAMCVAFNAAYGFFGFKSHACETSFRSNPSGENSAICGPRGVWNSTRNKCAPINSRAVPLSMARKCPLIQFQL